MTAPAITIQTQFNLFSFTIVFKDIMNA